MNSKCGTFRYRADVVGSHHFSIRLYVNNIRLFVVDNRSRLILGRHIDHWLTSVLVFATWCTLSLELIQRASSLASTEFIFRQLRHAADGQSKSPSSKIYRQMQLRGLEMQQIAHALSKWICYRNTNKRTDRQTHAYTYITIRAYDDRVWYVQLMRTHDSHTHTQCWALASMSFSCSCFQHTFFA